MNIIHKSIYIINYETQQVILREPPATFDSYVAELINHISNNTSVREYKTHSDSTEVISCILKICANQTNENSVLDRMKILARRLLLEETKAQIQIRHTNTTVQKGSLIQALLFDDIAEKYVYLLAKVEHTEWVDDSDFTFKSDIEIKEAFKDDELLRNTESSTRRSTIIWSVAWGILLVAAIIIIEVFTANHGLFVWLWNKVF